MDQDHQVGELESGIEYAGSVYAIEVSNESGLKFGIKSNGQIELTDKDGEKKIVDGDEDVIQLVKEFLRIISTQKSAEYIKASIR